MPRLDTVGHAVMGRSGGPASVDGRVVITPGGGPASFINHMGDTILVNSNALGPWLVLAVNVASGAATPLANEGANDLCAGSGRWLAWNPSGMFGSLGRRPDAGVRGAGLDGTLGYCPNRQQGTGLILNAPDGSEVTIPGAQVYDEYALQILGPGRAIWFDGSTVQWVGVPPLRFASAPGKARLVQLSNGEDWLVYWAPALNALVAQRNWATDGYILQRGPVAFNHDACCPVEGPQAGELVVAWSTTQGEGPSDLRKLTVDRSRPRVPLTGGPAPSPTDDPIVAIGRPLYLAGFRFDNSAVPLGNGSLAVRNVSGHQDRPVILTDETLGQVSGAILGQYISGVTVEAIEAAAARSPFRPVAYWDARRWPRVPNLPGGSWLCIQAYCRAGEPIQQFEADLRQVLLEASLSRYPLALVAQCYTSNTGLTTDLRALVPVFARLCRDFPAIAALLPFSFTGRATGYQDHPEIHASWETLASGILGMVHP